MSKLKLTPWFPANVNPAHVGIYETLSLGDFSPAKFNGYSHWNGIDWSIAWETVKTTAIEETRVGRRWTSKHQSRRWRGVQK